MKTGIKRALAVVLALAMTLGLFSAAQGVLARKEGRNIFGQFFQEDLGVEVLFLGTSHVFCGIDPLEMWRDYGIPSYVLADQGARMAVSYWTAANALECCQPKVIVLDCYLMSDERAVPMSRISQREVFAQNDVFDAMPFGITKLRAIYDLYRQGVSKEWAQALCWPFYANHSRWSELGQGDMDPGFDTSEKDCISGDRMKGMQIYAVSATVKEPRTADEPLDLEGLPGPGYIRELAQLCEQRGVELVLTYVPFPTTQQEYAEALAAEELAGELGLRYIDLFAADLVDYRTDMMDGFHLNYSGAMKLTDYFGKLLSGEGYSLADHRQDPDYQVWWEDLAYMDEKKLQVFQQCDTMAKQLTMLQDDWFSAAVRLEEGSPVYEDEKLIALLENAAGQELPGLEAAALAGEAYGLILDREEGLVRELPANELDALQEEGMPQLPEGDTVLAAWPAGEPDKALSRSFQLTETKLV